MRNNILLCLSLIISAETFSQNTELSGTWEASAIDYIAGPQYANALPKKIIISKRSDSLIIETISTGNGNDIYLRMATPKNGDKIKTKSLSGSMDVIRSHEWQKEGKVLVITSLFFKPANNNPEITRVETLMIENGKLLIHKKVTEITNDSWEVKGMFSKINP